MKPIQRFYGLLKLDRKDITQIVLYALLSGLVSLTLPLGIQAIINFIQSARVSTSWIILVVMVVLGVAFVGILRYMQFRLAEIIQQKLFVRSAFEFAYRFPRMAYKVLMKNYLPELANRFFDTVSIQKGYAKILLEISSAVLQVVFGLILLTFYHPYFIAFGLLMTLMLFIIFKINFHAGLKSSLEESKYKYQVAHWIQEIARNYFSFNDRDALNFALEKNNKLVNNYLTERENHFKVLRNYYFSFVGFKIIITALLLLVGGLLVINQEMNIGQFVAAEIVILTIVTSVDKLFVGVETFYDVLTSLEKIGNVVDLELEENEPNFVNNTAKKELLSINFQEVSYTYDGNNNPTLNRINLEINPKSIVLINGDNGSGKSTLLRLIAGLLKPTEGYVFVNGKNINMLNPSEYQRCISYISESQTLFEGTIIENILGGNNYENEEKVRELCKQLDILNYINKLPQGFQSFVKTNDRRVPYSVVRKIQIARAILKQPELLILEEPFSNLEQKAFEQTADLLTDPRNNWSIVVVSQQKYWESKCTQHYHLIHGNLNRIK